MTPSAIMIGLHRLAGSEALMRFFQTMAVIRLPDNARLPAVVVNRVFERDAQDHENCSHVVGLIFSVMASTPEQMEEGGQLLVDEIDGSQFDDSDLSGITFNKGGSDVTAFDGHRAVFIRQIEFCMEW